MMHVRVQDMHTMHVMHEMHAMHVCYLVLMHHMWCTITMSLLQALMDTNLHVKNMMKKYKEMTWFNSKSIGSYLVGGTRIKFLLASLSIQNFLLGFSHVAIKSCVHRDQTITELCEHRRTDWAVRTLTEPCTTTRPCAQARPNWAKTIPSNPCIWTMRFESPQPLYALYIEIWNKKFWMCLYTLGSNVVLSMWDISQFVFLLFFSNFTLT